jgi:hypothetical protein
MNIRTTLAALTVVAGALTTGPIADAAEVRSATVRSTPARMAPATPAVPQNKRLSAPPGSTRYTCTTENNHTECVCKGMLDCNNLIQSGDCKGGTPWEDSDDPSIGGCG